MMRNSYHLSQGFTLIELSIVLVIIGLIVGGVLVGQDLIRAAGVRAQISQIERYNTAANTFRGKYSYLPGDIKDPDASNFGLFARGSYAGQGDGNGVIEGVWQNGANSNEGIREDAGETVAFWVDLSMSGLIEDSFLITQSPFTYFPVLNGTSSPSLNQRLPAAKIGQGNTVYVWSGGTSQPGTWASTGINYFGLSAISTIPSGYIPEGQPGLTVQQAYSIDKKVDDGLPQTGNVTAQYVDGVTFDNDTPGYGWAGTAGVGGAPYTTATAGSSSTCFDNGNAAGGAQQYSLEQNGGAGVNCALSFRFQ